MLPISWPLKIIYIVITIYITVIIKILYLSSGVAAGPCSRPSSTITYSFSFLDFFDFLDFFTFVFDFDFVTELPEGVFTGARLGFTPLPFTFPPFFRAGDAETSTLDLAAAFLTSLLAHLSCLCSPASQEVLPLRW